MIVIPKTFQLGGRTWTVEVHDLIDSDQDLHGDTDSSECVIRLRKGKPELMQHTFYHELCHAIAYTLGWRKFNKDEDKIDSLGGMFYQYLKTKRGNLGKESRKEEIGPAVEGR